MGAVPNTFYEDVLRRISAPITEENLRACHAWQAAEGGTAHNNPWNTTEPEPGTSNYNSFGPNGEFHVKNYPSESEGIDATARTLLNGDYPDILKAFRSGHDGHSVCVAVDQSRWGTHGSAATYARIYGTTRPSFRTLQLQTPYMQGSDVVAVQRALVNHGNHLTVDGIYGPDTASVVRGFQTNHHMAVDGIVGPRTRAALGLPD